MYKKAQVFKLALHLELINIDALPPLLKRADMVNISLSFKITKKDKIYPEPLMMLVVLPCT